MSCHQCLLEEISKLTCTVFFISCCLYFNVLTVQTNKMYFFKSPLFHRIRWVVHEGNVSTSFREIGYSGNFTQHRLHGKGFHLLICTFKNQTFKSVIIILFAYNNIDYDTWSSNARLPANIGGNRLHSELHLLFIYIASTFVLQKPSLHIH